MLERKRVYRLSDPLVAIGWMFLCVGTLVIAFAVFYVGWTHTYTAEVYKEIKREAAEDLKQRRVLQKWSDRIYVDRPLSSEEIKQVSRDLSPAGARAVIMEHAMLDRSRAQVVSEVFYAYVFLIASIVGLLPGYLLTIRKNVLQCSNCTAVIPAG